MIMKVILFLAPTSIIDLLDHNSAVKISHFFANHFASYIARDELVCHFTAVPEMVGYNIPLTLPLHRESKKTRHQTLGHNSLTIIRFSKFFH